MTQVKFFDSTSSIGVLERKINEFLSEHTDKIEVKDIKYTAESKEGHSGRNVTGMVIYEIKDESILIDNDNE